MKENASKLFSAFAAFKKRRLMTDGQSSKKEPLQAKTL